MEANSRKQKVAVLGAGNGGLAIAANLSDKGFKVILWNRSKNILHDIEKAGGIWLINGAKRRFIPVSISYNLENAVKCSTVLMVTTTADAHAELTLQLIPYLENGQTILLNPGRTGGALEVRTILGDIADDKSLIIGEASSLVYACRAVRTEVTILQEKSVVHIAAFPARDTKKLCNVVKPLFPVFEPKINVLQTSFENVGAMFHPPIVLLNTAVIEKGIMFYFYRDMSNRVANLLTKLDKERITVAKAYDISVPSLSDWIKQTYPDTPGIDLIDYMRNCNAYSEIIAPTRLDSRLLLEDIPTGLVPLFLLGKERGVSMPITRSLVDMASAILDIDFWKTGRTIERMGLREALNSDLNHYLQNGTILDQYEAAK